MEFAHRLTLYREQAHLTQEQLAQALQVSRSAVAQWERGLNWPALPQFMRLCQILNISCSALLEDPPP